MLKKSVLFFTILGIVQILSVYVTVQYFSMPWEQACKLVAVVSGLLGVGFVALALFAKEHPSNHLIGMFGFLLLGTAWCYGFKFDQDSFLGGVDTIVGVLPLLAAVLVLRRGEPSAPIWRIVVSWSLVEWIIAGASDLPLVGTNEGVKAVTLIFVYAGLLAYAVAAVGRKSPVPSQA